MTRKEIMKQAHSLTRQTLTAHPGFSYSATFAIILRQVWAESKEISIMRTLTETRTFTPEECVPAETLAEFSVSEIEKEFSYIAGSGAGATVNGWTVTISTTTDDPDEATIRVTLRAYLDAIPARAMKAFS